MSQIPEEQAPAPNDVVPDAPSRIDGGLLEILDAAAQARASDVLLTAGAPISWRRDGLLAPIGAHELDAEDVQREVYGLLQQEQIARLETTRELDFSVRIPGSHRFRGNAYWQRGAVGASLRLVPRETPPLSSLGLPKQIEALMQEVKGLVLVTGATGQGKSTTLAVMVAHINATRPTHIITIEDPIEFEHKNERSIIDQREVGSDTHSFAAALRHVIRQSPDVIMVGEMRDQETIAAALTAAETGHLVLATLHTNDAAQSVDRIIDVFPPTQQQQVRGQLAQALLAVVSQRLLSRADGKGRVLAAEVLIATSAVRHMIRDDKTYGLITTIETGAQYGMQTMDQALRVLLKRGEITREVAIAHARDPDRMR